MKKILFIIFCILLVGCKSSRRSIVKNIEKKFNSFDEYKLNGELVMYNGDTTYKYDVVVNHKDDLYNVTLNNKINNHEQVILRNNDGVYVLTPSINKSFKFQSDWPFNNSQIYILEQIYNDIKSDKDIKINSDDNEIVISTKVNYSTNNNLTNQKIYFSKEYDLTKVDVFNDSNELQMSFKVNKIDTESSIDDGLFEVNNVITDKKVEDVTNNINDVIYPMYLPVNTYLKSEEKVSTNDGERVILTFAGDKGFTLIEENISVSKDLDMVLSYGEPDIIIDTVGIIDDAIITWVSDGISYSIMSNELDNNELYSVARSISSSSITK